MSLYYPEGWIIDTPQNRAAMANISTLTDACHEGQILEGRALICDSAHNLIVASWLHERNYSKRRQCNRNS